MKRFRIIAIISLTISLCLSACKSHSDSDMVEAEIDSWIGREFQFCDLPTGRNGEQLKGQDFYLLTYLDSTVCNSCRIQAWKEYVSETAVLANCRLGCIMVLSPECVLSNSTEFSHDLSQINYIVDDENLLLEKNDIPNDDRLRVFLLNREHRIVCIGNPIINTNVRELFLSYISDFRSFSETPQTHAVVSNPVLRYERLVADSLTQSTFWVRNAGGEEMLIRNIATSCSCVSAQSESNRIMPGDSALITVSYRPTHAGQIMEKIYLNYNGENSPITMVIKGNVHL